MMNNKNGRHVYIYWIDNVPFYVGRGQGEICHHGWIAKLLHGVRANNIKVTLFIKDVDEETALFWEGFIIRSVGRRCDENGSLCNLTLGGTTPMPA